MDRRVRLRAAPAERGRRAPGHARLGVRHGGARREDALRAGGQSRRRAVEPAHRPHRAAGVAGTRARPRHGPRAVVPPGAHEPGRRRRDDEADRRPPGRRRTRRRHRPRPRVERGRRRAAAQPAGGRVRRGRPAAIVGDSMPIAAIVYPAVQLEVLNTTLWPDFPYRQVAPVRRRVDADGVLHVPLERVGAAQRVPVHRRQRRSAPAQRSATTPRRSTSSADWPRRARPTTTSTSNVPRARPMPSAGRCTTTRPPGSWAWPYLRGEVPVPTTLAPPTTAHRRPPCRRPPRSRRPPCRPPPPSRRPTDDSDRAARRRRSRRWVKGCLSRT